MASNMQFSFSRQIRRFATLSLPQKKLKFDDLHITRSWVKIFLKILSVEMNSHGVNVAFASLQDRSSFATASDGIHRCKKASNFQETQDPDIRLPVQRERTSNSLETAR